MSRLDLYQLHAIEKEGLPENWRVFRWEAFPKSAREECLYVQVTGAVCEYQYLKGKRKGEPNWNKRDARTERVVILPIKEHDDWKRNWEQRTGLCSECTGTGKVFQSWSINEGTNYRTCPRCKGSAASNLSTVDATTDSCKP